jgi:hypothetical protein
MVVDVWEPPEAFGRFGHEEIAPAGEAIGFEALEPRFVPVRHRLRSGSGAAR